MRVYYWHVSYGDATSDEPYKTFGVTAENYQKAILAANSLNDHVYSGGEVVGVVRVGRVHAENREGHTTWLR